MLYSLNNVTKNQWFKEIQPGAGVQVEVFSPSLIDLLVGMDRAPAGPRTRDRKIYTRNLLGWLETWLKLP